MDFVVAVVADEQAFELVEPGEGALDNPAVAAETRAVASVASRDLRRDAALAELSAVTVVVVTAIGAEAFRSAARSADLAAHRWDTVDERDQLSAVVAVAAGDCPGERDPGRVYEKVMLGA